MAGDPSDFVLIDTANSGTCSQVLGYFPNFYTGLLTSYTSVELGPFGIYPSVLQCEGWVKYTAIPPGQVVKPDDQRITPVHKLSCEGIDDPAPLGGSRAYLQALLTVAYCECPQFPEWSWDGKMCVMNAVQNKPILTLTPAPNQTPLDPRPRGTEGKDPKSSSLELIAKVMEGSTPKAGVVVGFGVGVETFTGGHAHGDLGSIPRPKGRLSKQSGETDTNGEIKLTFFADEPAGLHAIVADCAPAGCTTLAKHVVKVKVPDLIHIPPDTETPPRYTLVGNVGDASNGYKTFQHNLTHYLTEQSWSNLKTLISTFIDLDWGQIGINDASLEWGGLFDIEGKWTTSGGHAEHRDGKQVDISFVRPLSVSADKRQKVFDEVCASKGAALPVVLWHQNDGYAPHFHIYLTGQSATGAKKTVQQTITRNMP